MIIRIVKMNFNPSEIENFTHIFNDSKHLIRSFKGCNHLSLFQDKNFLNIFFTYSYWESEDDLNNYRNSVLFKNVWSQTKLLFQSKAEAWSLNLIDQVNSLNEIQ